MANTTALLAGLSRRTSETIMRDVETGDSTNNPALSAALGEMVAQQNFSFLEPQDLQPLFETLSGLTKQVKQLVANLGISLSEYGKSAQMGSAVNSKYQLYNGQIGVITNQNNNVCSQKRTSSETNQVRSQEEAGSSGAPGRNRLITIPLDSTITISPPSPQPKRQRRRAPPARPRETESD